MQAKTLIVTSVFLLVVIRVLSQEWFPPAASWYYSQTLWPVPGVQFRYFEVMGDTVIQGKSCVIVTGDCECGESGYFGLLHVDGDRVYSYDSDKNVFILLYDFTLEAGDTLTIQGDFAGDTQYMIDSVTLLNIAGLDLRVQHISVIDGWLDLGDRIYEFLGSDQCLYPQVGFCDPLTGRLRCYEDQLFGLISFIEPELSCDHIVSSTEDEIPELVYIYPNPASQFITTTGVNSVAHIESISVITGQMIMVPRLSHNHWDVSGFETGTYLFRLSFERGGVALVIVVII